MSITEKLLPLIEKEFPDKNFAIGTAPDPILTILAPNEGLREIQVFDEGEEATIVFGTLTHSHFSCYEATFSPDQKESAISDDVVSFFRILFSDKVLLWISEDGKSGGWSRKEAGLTARHNAKNFLWSGPLPEEMTSSIYSQDNKSSSRHMSMALSGAGVGTVLAIMVAYPMCAEWTPRTSWMKYILIFGTWMLLVTTAWRIRKCLSLESTAGQAFAISLAASFVIVFFGICTMVWAL